MSGKHLLKLFSYACNNRNRFLNFSVKPFFRSRNGNKSFVRSLTTELSKPIVTKDLSLSKLETASFYYWRFLVNNNSYYSYFNTSNQNSPNESNYKSIKLLSDLSNVEIFTEENIKLSAEVLSFLEKEISMYGFEDLCQALALTYKCKMFVPETNNNLEKMRKCIDDELCKRYLSSEESLKVLSILNVAQKGMVRPQSKNLYFVMKTIMKLLNKVNNLTPQQIVLLFFCSPVRDLSTFDSKYYVLSYLSENLSKFNADELGIIAFGLFRLNLTFSQDKIFWSFTEKTLQEIENIQPVPFRSICRVLQKFMRFLAVPNSLEFQEQLVPYASKLDSICLLEASLLCAKQNALNNSFKNEFVKHITKGLNNFTIRNFLRLMNLTVSCNIQDEALLIPVMKEIESRVSKEENFKLNEALYIKITKQFSHHQLYSQLLLEKALSVETFNTVKNRDFPASGKLSWWSLYCSINLEKPDYSNESLNSSSLKSLHKENRYLMNSQISRFENKTIFSVLNVLRRILIKLYTEDKVFLTYTLSHYDPGIVLVFNEELRAQSIPEKFKVTQDFLNKKPLKDNNYWLFITILNSNDFLFKSDKLKLSKQTQLRQLELLGYIPFTVKYPTFKEAVADDGGKFFKNFLEEKLKSLPLEKKMSN